ncbi:MAG: SDR family NAD(P)-dependent oxidoreductase [Rhodothermia bacterium]|nr:SDR family NAD(P)-dependent oxidoreductase [Rhodothermia bacterium]
MSHGRFNHPVIATLAGLADRFRKAPLAARLTDADRFDGKTLLITGANSGLGYAMTVEAARRGGSVVMGCRSEIPDSADRARRDSGSDRVSIRRLDLSKAETIHSFVDGLVEDELPVDVVILNAATTLPQSRRLDNGQDEMFMVNYLANFILVNLLLVRGVIHTDASRPRMVFISSDSHQGASAIDHNEFGRYFEYGVRKAINNYSYFKLVLNTFAVELSRRLQRADSAIDVHVICPGPVNSNIIKEAPQPLRAVLRVIFTVVFPSPAKAAKAPIYMAASDDFSGAPLRYLHMFSEKRMDEKVYAPDEGERLWTRSAELWRDIDSRAEIWEVR